MGSESDFVSRLERAARLPSATRNCDLRGDAVLAYSAGFGRWTFVVDDLRVGTNSTLAGRTHVLLVDASLVRHCATFARLQGPAGSSAMLSVSEDADHIVFGVVTSRVSRSSRIGFSGRALIWVVPSRGPSLLARRPARFRFVTRKSTF